MTIFGPDLSSFQDGLDVGALPYPFVIAKCTEGTYYTDRDYSTWRAQAEACGKHFIAYHFISGQDPAEQAAHLAANIGDKRIPVMLDWEPTGTFRPTLAQLYAVADAVRAASLNLRLAYAPRWHWVNIGSPDLTGLTDRRVGLVASAYPGGYGYPGDDAAGWTPYGGVRPLLYQYTNQAPEQGRQIDMNAFRGSADLLAAYLGLTTPLTEGPLMATIPPSIAGHFAGMDLSGDFPPNGTYTVEGAVLWADARAEAAYRQAVANGAKLDQLLQHATPAPPPPAIDVDALAAALAPHLTAGASADDIAHAVVMHLADVLKAG